MREIRLIVDNPNERIDKIISSEIEDISRSGVQSLIKDGLVRANGKIILKSAKLSQGDEIIVSIPDPVELDVLAENIPIDIVYEDDDILVVNKQPGLVVHPGFGNFDGTLLNAVAWHMKDNEGFDANDARLGLVHRIDKDTSGLLIVAKTANAKTHLGKQFFDKTTHRRYLALVWGSVKEDEGTIVGAMARDPRDRMLFTVFAEGENPLAKHAVTHYKVLERFAHTTLVECRLETGRTHQIRVHMKHIGHTLFNDKRYGGSEILKGVNNGKYKQFIKNCFEICPRQALHAKTLGFVHPRTGKDMYFDSELPEDIQQLIEKWRNYNVAGRESGENA